MLQGLNIITDINLTHSSAAEEEEKKKPIDYLHKKSSTGNLSLLVCHVAALCYFAFLLFNPSCCC